MGQDKPLIKKLNAEEFLKLNNADREFYNLKLSLTEKDFDFINGSQISNDKVIDWLIPDLMQRNSVSVLYGAKGTKKTFLAMYMAYCFANGLEVLNNKPSHTRVAYLGFEDPQQISYRLPSFNKYFGVEECSYNFRVVSDLLKFPPYEDEEGLLSRAKLEILAERNDFMVVDVLDKTFVGDENSAVVMRASIDQFSRVASKFKCTILVLHHTTQNTSNPRGSTVLENTAQTMMFTNGKELKVTKQRHGKVGRKIKFDLKIEDDYVVPVFVNVFDSYKEHQQYVIHLLSETAGNKLLREDCLALFKERFIKEENLRQSFKRAVDFLALQGHVTRDKENNKELLILNYESK